MEITFVSFGLPLGIVVLLMAIYLFFVGLRDPEETSWTHIIIGGISLLLFCSWVIVATIYGLQIFAFLQIIVGVITAVFTGLFLTFFLKRWKRVIGIIIAVGIPLVLYASFQMAFPYSPDQVVRRNGEQIIVKALNEYYVDNKTYPQTLSELIPNYVNDLREPKSTWGWLYTGNDKDFTLGYVFHVDKMGYAICKFSASSPKWVCPLDYSTTPFSLAPTPMP